MSDFLDPIHAIDDRIVMRVHGATNFLDVSAIFEKFPKCIDKFMPFFLVILDQGLKHIFEELCQFWFEFTIGQNSKNPKIIKYIPSLKECEDYLRENISREDLVLLIGAGDVFRIGENLVE